MSDEVANRLQHVRKMYGLSQRELAKRAGVTNSSVSMIEQGRVSPSFSSLEKLLNGIPMTVKDFFNLDYQTHSQAFYRSFELFDGSEEGVDTYRLSDSNQSSATLLYQVYNAGSDSGKEMRVEKDRCHGIIIQGDLDITISNDYQSLSPGDGFIVEPLSPYRIVNPHKDKAIVVISYH